MKKILTLNLENDMDLILAHRRVMKLSELCGLSLPVQTIFATAISEIARIAIEKGLDARLHLGIVFTGGHKKWLETVIADSRTFCHPDSEAIGYARRLADDVQIRQDENGMTVTMRQSIPFPGTVTEAKVQSFIEYFQNERPLSPYDELRRKNLQLEELARQLRESEHNYSQLTNSLPIMMFCVDRSGKVFFTNKWLRDFLGFDVKQFSAIQCQPFLHPDDYGDLYERWLNLKETTGSLHGQVRLKHIDTGQYLWHLLSIRPFRADNGVVEQWTGFLVDIHAQKLVEQTLQDNTELKTVQRELKEYQEELENKIQALNQSNHDLEQFAYIASHDLQEPLRKIRTFLNLIRRESDKEHAIATYFSRIDNAAERMSLLINGVLDYSRVTNTPPAFETVDLAALLKQVEGDFEALIQQKKAVVRLIGLPEVLGQPLQLRQLFSNLLSNALKFTEAEPVITLRGALLSVRETANRPELKKNYRYALITFEDNGIGFDDLYADKIFTIFQQLNPRNDYGGGTGIGLALCKKIAERHQGHISASSRPGEGATFRIYLPVAEIEA